jgi:hypothetical protein
MLYIIRWYKKIIAEQCRTVGAQTAHGEQNGYTSADIDAHTHTHYKKEDGPLLQ